MMRKILLLILCVLLTILMVSCTGHSGDEVDEAADREEAGLDESGQSDESIEPVMNEDSAGKEEVKESNGEDIDKDSNIEDTVWSGEWQRVDGGRFYQATLTISDQREGSFYFQLGANNGANTGLIEGIASIINDHEAFYADKETGAELTFQLNAGEIELAANEAAGYYGGSGVRFDGVYGKDYIPEPFTLLSSGMVETEEEEKAFSALVGEDLELFLDTAQIRVEEEDLDGYGASVYHWYVSGVASYNTSIIMFLPDGKICAAVIDLDEHIVKVYTDAAYIRKVPATIESWNEDGWEVLFVNKL